MPNWLIWGEVAFTAGSCWHWHCASALTTCAAGSLRHRCCASVGCAFIATFTKYHNHTDEFIAAAHNYALLNAVTVPISTLPAQYHFMVATVPFLTTACSSYTDAHRASKRHFEAFRSILSHMPHPMTTKVNTMHEARPVCTGWSSHCGEELCIVLPTGASPVSVAPAKDNEGSTRHVEEVW